MIANHCHPERTCEGSRFERQGQILREYAQDDSGENHAGPTFHRPLCVAAVFVLALVVTPLSGCSYSQSGSAPKPDASYQWRSLYREDVRTVAVPIFKNKTFEHGVEFALSKAVVNALEANTPYKVAPRDRADSILEGQVEYVGLRTVSNDSRSAIPQEQLYVVRVNFTWKDLRTGRMLCQRDGFEQTASFYPTLGEGIYVGQQSNVERLAQGIVEELQADW